MAPKKQESNTKNQPLKRLPQIVQQRIQSRAQTKEILLLPGTLALYSTFTMLFLVILTSIPSTKVVFCKSSKLAKRVKKRGERIKEKAKMNKSRRSKNKRDKNRRHRSFGFQYSE
jgi:hypothetical protein